MTWGNQAGPGPSYFYAYAEWRVTQYGENSAYLQYKHSLWVDSGDFGGTLIGVSWGDGVRCYGPGWYRDSGWQDYGWVSYGKSAHVSNWAAYTSWNGSYYKSACSSWYSPSAPTWQPRNVNGQSASRVSDTAISVSWKNDKTAARPYAGIYVYVSVDGGDFALADDCDGGATSYRHASAANHAYRFRILPHNAAGNAPAHQYTGWTATTPAAPSAASVARNSDNQNTVTFTPGSSYAGLYSGHRIERSVNGGSWSFLDNVAAEASRYVDATTQKNASYRYRVRSYNSAGSSGWKETGTVYNTPAQPGRPALSRVSDMRVRAEFSNESNTETSLQIQRSADAEAWADVRTVSGHVTSFEDDPGGGTFYYRIRNVRGSLTSAWAYSDGIVTICAPAAPTVVSPSSSQVIDKSQASIGISWRHNPIDGSAQTAAQWRYSTDNGATWATRDVPGGASSDALANSFAVNARLVVQVRTKGAHVDFGPWSAAVATYVCQVPTVTVEDPGDGFVVENTPVHVRISYSDQSGSLAAAILTVCDSDGREVYSRDVSDSLEFDIPAGEWLPSNGETYSVDVNARSSSTLQGRAHRTVSVDYAMPSIAIADAVPDPATGYVTVTVREGRTDALERMESCSLWRVSGGERVLLGEGLQDGSAVVDRYAPLNTDYSYETASFANSGAASEARYAGRVESNAFFVYWGDGNIASGTYNAQDSFTVTPDYETIEVAGKEFPVVVMGTSAEEPHDLAVSLKTRDEAMAFYRMARSCQPVVVKTLYGFVFNAVAVPKFTPELSGRHTWEVSLSVTRVDGGAL